MKGLSTIKICKSARIVVLASFQLVGYGNRDGQGVCEDCPPGRYSPAAGASVCTDCTPGKYPTAGPGANSSYVCLDCFAGKYSPIVTAEIQAVCTDW